MDATAMIAYLDATPDDDAAPDDPPAWSLVSEADASYGVDTILGARERAARIKERCAALVADAERRAVRAEAFFLPLLQRYYQEHPPAKGKTIHLPAGDLKSYAVRGGPRVVDAQACLVWARAALPVAVRVVESVDVAAVKAHIATTGELPPGVEVQADEERFSVK